MDGTALVLCDGFFNTPSGKTAHGLVRGTERYKVLGVIDRRYAGRDAREVLDGKPAGIPVFESLQAALTAPGSKPDFLVMGVAPDGGLLPPDMKQVFLDALRIGINADSGLHQHLSDDPELTAAAAASGASIRDIRRCKPVSELHFFEGVIDEVKALRVAILGTDSAIGKRTTTRILLEAFREKGISAAMVGTGQTAWLQGIPHTMLLDATINDFVSGELEHTIHQAWLDLKPRVILIEGQGSITNPAYPGGFEIIAAGRPQAVIIQHAPKRIYYDGFEGIELAGLDKEKQIIELLSGKPVTAITINHEDMTREEVEAAAAEYERKYGISAADVLIHGPDKIVQALENSFPEFFQ